MEIRGQKLRLIAENADLSQSAFDDVNLSNARFRNANLSEAAFEDVRLAGARFRDVNLAGVAIADCDVSGMTIDGVPVSEALAAYRAAHPTVGPELVLGDATTIRPFQESDEPAVIELWTSVFNYAAAHNDPAAAIRQKLKVDRDLFRVAVIGGTVVGTIIGGYDGHRGWIYSLAVRPDRRRQGIATGLVRSVELALADRGCTKVNLQLLQSNAETVAFYEMLGYAVEDRVSMGRRL